MSRKYSKKELFETLPVPRALAAMSIPTIISQLINLIYNMVDAFFIGRTGNSYMMAATTLTLTLNMLNVAFSNMFGIGGGSLTARLMGQGKTAEAGRVSAFSIYSCILLALTYSALVWIFMDPLLTFLGASEATIGYARQYAMIVTVAGSTPVILSQTAAHLLRNAGYSAKASIGLSSGGILNILLDPLFMFVILPPGYEVVGAALATLIANAAACTYLLTAYRRASKNSPLSLSMKAAVSLEKGYRRNLFSVGVPSAILTGLFDVATICVNILSAGHSDLVLAGMGIVLKVERIPNAVNVGLCQGMMPLVAYNLTSGNEKRLQEVIRSARIVGLIIAAMSVLILELFAYPVTHVFLSTRAGDGEAALATVGYAAFFLRIRCTASPMQFLNYHSSFCMQAMGDGKSTMMHSCVRQLVFYIPFMFLLDSLFGETGLAAALPVGETCGAVFAVFLLRRVLRRMKEGRAHAVR